MVDDIYKARKCQYTGLPIFTTYCDCYIHSKRNNFTSIRHPIIKRSKSHELLKIFPPVTEKEIKIAYHKLALMYHPDKGGSNEKFVEINEAYNELLTIC